MASREFEPKLITVFREGYTRETLLRDATAGILVGIVAIPLAIAFAIASGVKPEQGLITAVIGGLLISVLGGSRVQIGGPTGAFVVLVYAVVQEFGYDGLVVATLMAGLLLVAMGFARLGSVIKFIPYPVTVGFTAGIAVIIGISQVGELFGLQTGPLPADFMGKLIAYSGSAGTWTWQAAAIGVATIAVIRVWPRVSHRIPGSLVALLLTTALAQWLALPVETIGSRFGGVPTGIPMPHLPHVAWESVPRLFSPALSIALLAGIESLLSAVVADGMTGRRHRSNMELVAQGVANIGSALFGGIPATGAIARTATNVKNGGLTPVAGIVHAVTVLLVLVFLGSWAAFIPMATLAGILLVVAWNMGEWHVFIRLMRSPRSDVLVLWSTFGLTVLVDLSVAIQVGVVLAALLFMRRMADVTQTRYVSPDSEDEEGADELKGLSLPPDTHVFEVNGPFFFGAAEKFRDAIQQIDEPPRVLILRLRKVLALDATGLSALEEVLRQTQRHGGELILSGVHAQPLVVMTRSGFLDRVGERQVCGNLDAALERAWEIAQGE